METALQADTDISTTHDAGSISHQNSNESNDDHSDRQSSDFDFGTTVLHSNVNISNCLCFYALKIKMTGFQLAPETSRQPATTGYHQRNYRPVW